MRRLLTIALTLAAIALPCLAQRGFTHTFSTLTATDTTPWLSVRMSEGAYPHTLRWQLDVPITADTCQFTPQGSLHDAASKSPFDLASVIDCTSVTSVGSGGVLAKHIRGSLALTGLAATATDCTNASPIVVTTAADHGYSTGDRVTITGVTGNAACNVENATYHQGRRR